MPLPRSSDVSALCIPATCHSFVASPMTHLVQRCTEALRSGLDFPILCHTIIKAHPDVAKPPVTRLDNDGRPHFEIALVRGDWLVVDLEAKLVRLR
jgi:hypothetical protein